MFDFDGVFTDNVVYVDQDGRETVGCWRSDGLGISRLKSAGVAVVIVSTETNPVVSARAAKLKVRCVQAVEDKGAAAIALCDEYGVSPSRAMFVGNDINDIPAFQVVGAAVAVADAHPDIEPYIGFRTRARGGRGAVREICDLLVAARQQFQEKEQ